jgi:hypothetical protein
LLQAGLKGVRRKSLPLLSKGNLRSQPLTENNGVKMNAIFDELKARFRNICRDQGILEERVLVQARLLTTEEALGNPEDKDYPIQAGKERLMEAEIRGVKGQAFTDRFGALEGTLNQILNMPIENNFRRAVLVATINAALRYLGLIEGTIHCRDEGPVECAVEMAKHIKARFGNVKITQIGLQPRILQHLSKVFQMRVLDLDPENIGQVKFGVAVEGNESLEDAIAWADLLLVTGTTLVNSTIGTFLRDKPVIFYGTTIAGAAYLMGWERFCARSL